MFAKGQSEIAWPGTARLTIPDAEAVTWLATLMPGMVVSLVTVLPRGLVRRIQRGGPFVVASVTVLRMIALALIAGGVLVAVTSAIATGSVLHRAVDVATGPGVTISLTEPLVCLVAGLLVAAVAEAFHQGVRLQQDVEGFV